MDINYAQVLDYKLAIVNLEQACQWSLQALKDPKPKFLVTLNPEIVINAQKDSKLKNALSNADFTVADGIGLTWAAKKYGYSLERVAGVELVERILATAKSEIRVFFLGSKPGVAEQAANRAKEKYGSQIAGFHHGYFDKNNADEVIELIYKSGADFLIAGLGEEQELFLYQNKEELNIPLMIGAGGTLDVLSGTVARSPAWTHKLRLEWAYRILSDRKRWHRFPRLVKFIFFVLAQSKDNS